MSQKEGGGMRIVGKQPRDCNQRLFGRRTFLSPPIGHAHAGIAYSS